MKIITKKGSKDYYDYLQGIYGVDEKIIYTRPVTKHPLSDIPPFSVNTESHLVAVYLCGEKIMGYYNVKTMLYYYGEALRQFDTSKKSDYTKIKKDEVFISGHRFSILPQPDINKLNEKYKQPVFFDERTERRRSIDSIEPQYPKLKDINFNHYMDAKTIWLKISDWLSPKDISMPVRPDKEKIVSHGFDLKTSFRKIK